MLTLNDLRTEEGEKRLNYLTYLKLYESVLHIELNRLIVLEAVMGTLQSMIRLELAAIKVELEKAMLSFECSEIDLPSLYMSPEMHAKFTELWQSSAVKAAISEFFIHHIKHSVNESILCISQTSVELTIYPENCLQDAAFHYLQMLQDKIVQALDDSRIVYTMRWNGKCVELCISYDAYIKSLPDRWKEREAARFASDIIPEVRSLLLMHLEVEPVNRPQFQPAPLPSVSQSIHSFLNNVNSRASLVSATDAIPAGLLAL